MTIEHLLAAASNKLISKKLINPEKTLLKDPIARELRSTASYLDEIR
ncbi:hypothetical protein [Rhodopseudomonas palustris]|nr:hypothetical protein [Rhodopseudomonas palustris]